ncbi:MAG: FAD-dependent oxidoreductase [Rubrivivax sp.]
MNGDRDVLVVGAGLAGTAAACVAAENGCRVLLVDHAPVGGGAVARQRLDPEKPAVDAPHARRWRGWQRRLQALGDRVEVMLNGQFAGIDAQAGATVVDAQRGHHRWMQPRAVILATGATEKVVPRPGWHLPGVVTAGGLQATLKMTGRVPPGPVLLAGSGPLLLAVAAQLCAAGRPPVAVVESGDPLRHWPRALRLPLNYWREAADYRSRLWRSGVPWLVGSVVQAIERKDEALRVTLRQGDRVRAFDVGTVALHDGLKPNAYGRVLSDGLLVRRAGDCAGIGGAWAADAHGACIGAEVARALHGASVATVQWERRLRVQQRAQAVLADVFASGTQAHPLPTDDATVLCRCEHRTLGDLRRLGPAPTVRELRLLGRFGMGACQGRYCLETVAQLCAASGGDLDAAQIAADRWPWRPVSIAALVNAEEPSAPS